MKYAFLTPKQDLDRKVQEAILAMRLEDQMTKDEILEQYLNTVYFGNGAYGVQAAAEVYFGKNAGQLDQADAALLAGIIKNPLGYDPIRPGDQAGHRRPAHGRARTAGGRAPDHPRRRPTAST